MKEKFTVTPWEVSGLVDYDKLIERFGTQKIDNDLLERIKKLARDSHFLLDNGFFFSHRDLDKALESYEKGDGFYLYTGRGPSGDMHIGHLIPFVFTKWLQEKFNANLYIQITDDEKFFFKDDAKFEEIEKYAEDNILDIAAIGFDPEKTFIFRDSEYLGKIYPIVMRIAKKVNFSNVRAVFGFKNETNIGMIFFPAIQMAPCFFEKKICLIPAAIDQDPYWRVARDIAPKLGYPKTAAIHSKFLPSLQGPEIKMSASLKETAIYLSDDPKTVKEKIMKYAFSGGQPTIKEHREKGGNPEIDISYQWLSIFFEPDQKKLKKIYDDYKSGKLLTGELKQILIDKINDFLENHRKQKEKAAKLIDKFKYNGNLAKKMWNL
jgi:tryptophanyl-tRNA synthetase